MTDYTPTGKPDDLTRYDARALRREFDLIEEAVNSKSDVGSDSTVSTTSMLVESPASKTFVAGTGKNFAPGQTVYIADTSAPATNNMTGVLVSYARETTGVMVVSVTSHNGSGTKTAWTIGVSNQSGVTLVSNTFTGHQNFARATVASHATTADIWNAAGNQIDFTGTAVVTDFPDAVQGGIERTLICAGACSFVASTDMEIDGLQSGGTVLCSANDIVTVRAVSTTKFRLTITRYTGLNGGSNSTSSAVDVTLTASSSRLQLIATTAAGKRVKLPDARTLSEGALVFAFKNTGLYSFALTDGADSFLRNVAPGQLVMLFCEDNSAEAGAWHFSGGELSSIDTRNTASVLNAVDSRNLAIDMLTATSAICAFRNNASSKLEAVVLNYGSASGTPLQIGSDAPTDISIAAQTSSQATVVYRTTGLKGYVLDITGSTTITPGLVRTIDAGTIASKGTGLAVLSSTQLLCAYCISTNDLKERVLTISSSTISESAAVIPDASAASSGVTARTITAAKALYAFRNGSNQVSLKLQSITAGVPAPTGTLVSIDNPPVTSADYDFGLTVLSADRALVAQPTPDGDLVGCILLTLFDISGTTPSIITNRALMIPLRTAPALSATKLTANRVYLTWLGSLGLGVDSAVVTVTSEDKLIISPVTEGVELNVTPANNYLACASLDSTHVMNVCRNSSTYLSAKVVGVAQ